MSTTGPTVTSAGLILAGTFVVLAVVGGSGQGNGGIRVIGVGLAVGILIDTFIVRPCSCPPSSPCSEGGTGGRLALAVSVTGRRQRSVSAHRGGLRVDAPNDWYEQVFGTTLMEVTGG